MVNTTSSALVHESLNNSASLNELLSSFVMSIDIRPSSRIVYKKCMEQFIRFISDTDRNFTNLNREDIISFKDYLLSRETCSHSELTVSLYMCVVRQFYIWTEAHHLYPNIARGVKNPRKNQKAFKKMHLTATQGEQYLEQFRNNEHSDSNKNKKDIRSRQFTYREPMNLRDYAIMTLMLYCGLRTIEVTRLDIRDVTFRYGQRILNVQGKGHDTKDSYVVLIDEAWEPLEKYLRTRKGAHGGEPLFPCAGYNSKGKRMSARRIQAICKEGMRAIGLDSHEYSAHSLRHTTGVMIVENGGDLLDVKSVLRHESTATSQIYVDSAMEELRLKNAPESRLAGCFKKTS